MLSFRAFSGLLLVAGMATGAEATGPFPEIRPVTRAQAAATLATPASEARACLTPEIQQALRNRTAPGTVRRALGVLQRRPPVGGVAFVADEGVTVRWTGFTGGQDIARRAALLEQITTGLREARGLLVDQLGLPLPADLEVIVISEVGLPGGYVLNPLRGATAIVVNAASGPEEIGRNVIHQYAHAVALAASDRFPVEWGEALASWVSMRHDGEPDPRLTAAIDRRLASLHRGLDNPALDLAAGNAAWLAFLDESWGGPAVRVAVEELARARSSAVALDRAVRRVSTSGLDAALGEFQLWSLFVGPRDDGQHLPHAARLSEPSFASKASGLPALSVKADPPVAPLGGSLVRLLDGDGASGGLRVHFEGEFAARWEADLVLTARSGSIHRVPIRLTDGRGEITVPLNELTEAVLMIRNLGGEDAAAHRYTWSAHREEGFPFELAEVQIEPLDGQGVLVQWETASEQRLVGFNIQRVRASGGTPVVVNPVWIPALGGPSRATSYRFLDTDADPEVDYVYRIQAITREGLTSHSRDLRAPASR